MVDHVSDSFLETSVPIEMLIKAAESGNGRQVEDCSTLFRSHAEKLLKVCSTNYKIIKTFKVLTK